MHNLLISLESLGLAKAEALVYSDIVQNPNSNGSQITKRIDLPKPSVYLALDKLYQRGLINLIPGKSKQYQAQSANIALEKLRAEFNANLDQTLAAIKELQQHQPQEEFIHILGYDNFIAQFKAMLANTKQELYIQSNADLNQFAPELEQLSKAGVKIIIYSFGCKYDYNFACEEYYDSAKACSSAYRLIVVADYKESIMSYGHPDNEYRAIYTRQELQVSLLSENIHNAIYWLKLYREQPDFTYPCRLETLAEQDIHISGYSI